MIKNFAALAIAGLTFFNSLAQTTAKEWYDKGIALKKSKSYKEATNAFKKAAALQTSYADALYQLGWCYNEEKMYNEAIDVLNKEEKAGSADKARNSFEMGYALNGIKKYDDAILKFNAAIDLDARYALAYKERGNSYYWNKDYKNALPDYTKYAELETTITDELFYYRKGWCENDQEEYNKAVESLKKCVALDKEYTDAFSELGYAYYKLNLNDDALYNYQIAMSLDKTDYHPVIGTADVYYDNLKNYDSAIVYYKEGLLLTRTNKKAYYKLGWCYNDKNNFTEAVDPLKQAVLLDAEYDAARTELGYAYYKLDKYDDALAQFRPIMAHDAKDELSRYYAGFCYYLKNDQEGLKKMIDELKELNSTKYMETLTKYIK